MKRKGLVVTLVAAAVLMPTAQMFGEVKFELSPLGKLIVLHLQARTAVEHATNAMEKMVREAAGTPQKANLQSVAETMSARAETMIATQDKFMAINNLQRALKALEKRLGERGEAAFRALGSVLKELFRLREEKKARPHITSPAGLLSKRGKKHFQDSLRALAGLRELVKRYPVLKELFAEPRL